jgi:hypothetical protein
MHACAKTPPPIDLDIYKRDPIKIVQNDIGSSSTGDVDELNATSTSVVAGTTSLGDGHAFIAATKQQKTLLFGTPAGKEKMAGLRLSIKSNDEVPSTVEYSVLTIPCFFMSP